jgi:hypothetical protein
VVDLRSAGHGHEPSAGIVKTNSLNRNVERVFKTGENGLKLDTEIVNVLPVVAALVSAAVFLHLSSDGGS